MPDRLTVTRQSGMSLDPVTLIEVPTWTVVYSDVPCSVAESRTERRVEQGGEPLSQTTFIVHVPPRYTDFEDGDTLTVTSSGDTYRPLLHVESVNAGTTTITRALACRTTGSGLNVGDYPEAS